VLFRLPRGWVPHRPPRRVMANAVMPRSAAATAVSTAQPARARMGVIRPLPAGRQALSCSSASKVFNQPIRGLVNGACEKRGFCRFRRRRSGGFANAEVSREARALARLGRRAATRRPGGEFVRCQRHRRRTLRRAARRPARRCSSGRAGRSAFRGQNAIGIAGPEGFSFLSWSADRETYRSVSVFAMDAAAGAMRAFNLRTRSSTVRAPVHREGSWSERSTAKHRVHGWSAPGRKAR